MKRVKYCRLAEDRTVRPVSHYEIADDGVDLIKAHTTNLFGHDFGNSKYIRNLLISHPDPMELARRLVRGLEVRIKEGANPVTVYEAALSWLESECSKSQKENN
jgi:hypothetical protein